MSAENLYLGVDGGGTHTIALLARNVGPDGGVPAWSILGRGEGGPSNPNNVGLDASAQVIAGAVRDAFANAKLSVGPVAGACMGIAGAGRTGVQQELRSRLQHLGIEATVFDVITDIVILLDAGTPQGWGIAVIGGTGSVAFGRNAEGRAARAGGWGHKFGDEGSGYALAIEALRAIARAADGRGKTTMLTERVLGELCIKTPLEIIGFAYAPSATPDALARLGRLVFEAARVGDAVARDILQKAASELGDTVTAVAQTLGMSDTPFPLALTGSLLTKQEVHCEQIVEDLKTRGLRPDPVAVVRDPVQGALRRAFRLAYP